MKILLIIPIYHPDHKFIDLLNSVQRQSITNLPLTIIDSGSDEEYLQVVGRMDNVQIKKIDPADFNHGGTRQQAIDDNPDYDIYIFLTQDAILVDVDSICNIVAAFDNPKIGCAYGRQLPHKGASIFAKIAREFNYGEESQIRFLSDREKYGIKTPFISNSFAAYRRNAVLETGGFPNNTILSEDMCLAARMLLKGWGVAYVAEAQAYHSHDYTIWQEFKRYFDIGVFHAREDWIRNTFGQAEGTGGKYVKYELQHVYKNPFLLGEMVLRDGAKYLGYRLGTSECRLPDGLKRRISMMPGFWT